MQTHADRYGRTIEQHSDEDGERFVIPTVGEMVLPIGTTWDNARKRVEAMAPTEIEALPVPETVKAWKAKIALHRAGLLVAAEAVVAQAGIVAQIAWAQADEWQRDGELLRGVAHALGLTESQVDDLFRAADAVTV